MPGKVKVKIIAGRNLPVMDRSSDTTDAYVEIKLGNTTYKTDVCRKSLNPLWNSEWYRFEVDDSELQDEPLQIRLMDHDTYSANDAIGKVYLNLNPLLIPAVALPGKYSWTDSNSDQPSSSLMSGWIPVYDTMHGIRGEVNVTVKVELFSDFNKFRQSSCGVQFFCSPVIPHGFHAQVIHGFIEELVVNDDPEYQWIDKIRTPRASNEARQTLFFKLSGELQRKIGVKALDLGGNAVIGYNQCFDLEGESGIVARGIGTVVTLIKHHEIQQQIDIGIAEEKALSYLKFLSFDNGLKLDSDNIFECFALSQPHPSRSLPSNVYLSPSHDHHTDDHFVGVKDDSQLFYRQQSQPLIERQFHRTHLNPYLSTRSLTEDIKKELSLRKLLAQKADSSNVGRRIKHLKSSSQNLLSKKITALKEKLSDSTMAELNYDTLATQDPGSIRTSLIDHREFRRQKKSKLRNSNNYMAELLVKSVMYAHTSLDCIAECHDSGGASSSASKLSDDLGEGTSHQSDISIQLLECEPIGLINKTISEPYLLIPDTSLIIESSNVSSSSDLTSSEDDNSEGLSDVKEDDKADFDTVSLIVKKVEEEELNHEYQFSYLDTPALDDTSMDEASDTEYPSASVSVNDEPKFEGLLHSNVLYDTDMPVSAPVTMNEKDLFIFSTSIESKIAQLAHSAVFNKYEPMSPPRKRGVLTKALSRSCDDFVLPFKQHHHHHHHHLNLIKTARHLCEKAHLIKHHSHNTHEDNIREKKEKWRSDPDLGNESLVKTAMQTMLMDKVNMMTSQPYIAAGEPFKNDQTVSFSASDPDLRGHYSIKYPVQILLPDKLHLFTSPTLSHKAKKEFKSHTDDSSSKSNPDLNVHSHHHNLFKNAMHFKFLSKLKHLTHHLHHEQHGKCHSSNNTSDSSSNLDANDQTFPVTFDEITKTNVDIENHSSNVIESTSTSHVEHIFCDTISAKSSDSNKDTEPFHNENKRKPSHKGSDFDHPSMLKTAMQTMLIDKANIIATHPVSVCTDDRRSESIESFSIFEHQDHSKDKNDLDHESLLKTAMQTMLLENVNIIASKSVPITPIEETELFVDYPKTVKHHSFFSNFKNKCKSLKSPKVSFSKFIHRHDTPKRESHGMVESGKNSNLTDKVTNIKGFLSSSFRVKSNRNKPANVPIESLPKQSFPDIYPESSESPSNMCTKQNENNLSATLVHANTPNGNGELDKGISFNNNNNNNKRTAVAADDANCSTNAEHASCLYPLDRHIEESPVPEKETTIRERHGHQRTESTGGKMSQSPARLNAIPCIHRRSSDSDLSITPKGNSLTGSDRSGGAIPGYHHIRSTLLRPTVDNFDMMEYPFLTMSKYPPGFILHLGGAVSARSVKLLERITNIEEPETRDTWWSELRTEIRTHARALNCNAVLGYAESTSICDEVCVLSASGTAAVIALYSGELSDGVGGLPNLHKPHMPNKDLMTSSLDRTDFERDKILKTCDTNNTNNKAPQLQESPEQEPAIELSTASIIQLPPTACRICHIPYSESNMSFRVNMLYCALCKMAKVPDILLATIEMPEGLPITGRGCFLQSYVCRPKRDLKGELNAKEISESLPFLEYELHRLLVNKMKVKAMNTIFGLKVRITIGERMLVGIATGTAVFLLPLPPPPLPKLIAGNVTTEEKKLSEMQKLLVDTVKKNKEIYELKDQDYIQIPSKILSDAEESDEEKSGLDLAAGNKDSCVLEVDDSEDIEVINLLVEPRPPDGFHVVNTENVPGLEELEIVRNLQMFTQVWRAKIPMNQSASHFGKHFQKLLQSVYFKLRRMIPCALCDLQFKVDLPEPDEIQLTLLGMALGLGDPMKLTKYKRKNLCHLTSKEHNKKSDDELIFSLEEDQIPENSIPVISQSGLLNPQLPKHRQKSPQRFRISTKQRHTPIRERHGVDITPLSYVPGGKIERYLGYLNFFFIRETTSIREGGGLSGFVHSFITEVLAIVRAHVTALGGNAMVAYFMTECVLYHNAHKNQGQCLINVGGDVVFVSYFPEDG